VNWIRDKKLGNLLIVFAVVMLIPLIIIGYFGAGGIKTVGQSVDRLEENTNLLNNLRDLRYQAQLYRINVYQLLYLQDESKIAECDTISAQITKIIDSLKSEGADTQLLADIEAKRADYGEAVEPIFDNYTDKDFVTTQLPKAVAAQEAYMDAVEALDNKISADLKYVMAQVDNSEAGSSRNIMIALIIGFILTATIIFLQKSRVIDPLRKSFSKVAETSQKLSTSSQKLSSNADAMGQATTQIASAISQVASGAAEQSRGSFDASTLVEQISSSIGQVAKGAQAQVISINEMATGISQLSGSIEDVSESATIVAGAVDIASGIANKGKGTVEETVTGMQRIKETVLSSANKIQTLGEKSKQIGEIIEVIDDIAEQTNLLALNAAIEAARAGEHGKGFAVVADEVRKLAERSARATGEIADLIKGIQDETMEAVAAMEKGTQEVEVGSELAANAGTVIEEMMGSIKQVVAQIAAVSKSAEQMAHTSDLALKAVDHIASIAQENSAIAEEVSSSSSRVVNAVNSIAASSQESAASAEEVSASSEEQAAISQEVTSQVQALASMSYELDELVANFNI